MTIIYIATGDALAVLRRHEGQWQATLQLAGLPTQCVAVDPHRSERIYCGTFGRGLWRSDDRGLSWSAVQNGIPYPEVMSVAVSPRERTEGYGVVRAGTEPSALFRSENGGGTWQERPALRRLPSASTWSFPPRPWTHHVRWIAPDPNVGERLFVGIELGGVMRSVDGGVTWEDRKPGSEADAHTLRMPAGAPGRVCEAAGGGYAESHDGGSTWHEFDQGLRHSYLWGLAVDPGDPGTLIVSASMGSLRAHDRANAESVIYRRSAGRAWQQVTAGLPTPTGTRTYDLAANQAEPGVFYAASHDGRVFRSCDTGLSWEQQHVVWPESYEPRTVTALEVSEDY